MPEILLARHADALFWMARYVERAENLARILDVNQTFSRDAKGNQNWLSIVQLYAEEAAFSERYGDASAEAVLRFYILDPGNPSSLVSDIRAARENARALRPLISTEMWSHLNRMHKRLAALAEAGLPEGPLGPLFDEIKEACQTHTGITEGTFYRDQGWCFYQIGRMIERADQTTRLLDMKYHLLLPDVSDVGRGVDVSQWNALLRSAAGYHAYRRVHSSGGLTPARVAGFLLQNPRFPRSVARCVRDTERLLMELRSRYMLRGGQDAAEGLDWLRVMLDELSTTEILIQGLHEFLDLVQSRLIAVSAALTRAFFDGGTALPDGAELANSE